MSGHHAAAAGLSIASAAYTAGGVPWCAATTPPTSQVAPLVLPAPAAVPPPPAGPALGCADLPSVGSATHSKGTCRPCAFLHTKGCENGLACTFCHLCEPGERKRRQKEKLQQRRTAQQLRQSLKAQAAALKAVAAGSPREASASPKADA